MSDEHTELVQDDPFTEQTGSPYAPNSGIEVEAMLEKIGVDDVEALFDIPESVRFDEPLGIESTSEQALTRQITETLGNNTELTEFLGRGYYSHQIPSIVDHLSLRSEFLTSYTQYQPETSQGFLQALFEYQSMLVELTGLSVANCSMYDAATSLGEAATLALRLRQVEGSRVLVPDYIRSEYREVLENYVDGTDLSVESFETTGGMVDPAILDERLTKDTVMIYAENPTVEGVIEQSLDEIGTLADEYGALFCLGSDTVALSLLQRPADVGADIVVGDASVLGLPAAHGMGLGLFACREEFLRQVPGRLVGASEDATDTRAYTLTLQTREQHIRRERATSNICTNQAWVALRTAIHAAWLGPDGLLSLAEQCHREAERLAAEMDTVDGISAPVYDGHHFREFQASVQPDARDLASDLRKKGFAVHARGPDRLQICVTDNNAHETETFLQAVMEVVN